MFRRFHPVWMSRPLRILYDADRKRGSGAGADRLSYAYEIRIAGRVSDDLLQTFTPDRAYQDAGDTVFVRTIADDGELFALIARWETLRLRLVSLRQIDSDTPRHDD